jgi:predicted site-specific integrase-resolvase
VSKQVEARPARLVPVLEGWLTAVEVAEVLGISRQSVARMMTEGVFRTLRQVGDRPLYVVRVEEVETYRDLFKENGTWNKAAEALSKVSGRRIGAQKA